MDASSAQTAVRVFAILMMVAAALSLIGGIAVVLYALHAPDAMAEALGIGSPRLVASLLFAYGIYSILLGVLDIFIGFGLWQKKNWARVTFLVVTWIYGVLFALALIFIVAFGGAAGVAGGLFYLIATAICALMIWLFQFEPAVRALFDATPRTARNNG